MNNFPFIHTDATLNKTPNATLTTPSITSGLSKRIIPCLDVHDGRVVKGISFVGLRDAGDPVEIAQRYYEQGADELTFLDISATHEERGLLLDMIEKVASRVFIPLTVGGGVRTLADIQRLLNCGADKVSINSAAVHQPSLINEASAHYGSQCIVVAIDAKKNITTALAPTSTSASASNEIAATWQVYTKGGRSATGLDVLTWAKELVARGAGEILLTSMDQDGQKKGFDLALTKIVSEAVNVPVIASGGVGTLAHLMEGIVYGKADAVLAASIFHYGEYTIQQAKAYLRENHIAVRS